MFHHTAASRAVKSEEAFLLFCFALAFALKKDIFSR
jgi:hypothetical protein